MTMTMTTANKAQKPLDKNVDDEQTLRYLFGTDPLDTQMSTIKTSVTIYRSVSFAAFVQYRLKSQNFGSLLLLLLLS